MLGQSPPYMLANKRGRHCSKSGMSPPRPSLNFDKMRKVFSDWEDFLKNLFIFKENVKQC